MNKTTILSIAATGTIASMYLMARKSNTQNQFILFTVIAVSSALGMWMAVNMPYDEDGNIMLPRKEDADRK